MPMLKYIFPVLELYLKTHHSRLCFSSFTSYQFKTHEKGITVMLQDLVIQYTQRIYYNHTLNLHNAYHANTAGSSYSMHS